MAIVPLNMPCASCLLQFLQRCFIFSVSYTISDTIRAPHEVAALADAGWFCSAGAAGGLNTCCVAVF